MLTHISGSSLEVTVDTPLHPCPRGITLPSPPAPLRTPHAAAAAAAAAFPLSPSAAAGHAAGLGPQEASPRAGGRPADFDPAVAAAAVAAAAAGSFYPLLRSEASNFPHGPHKAASMSPIDVSPGTSAGGGGSRALPPVHWRIPARPL